MPPTVVTTRARSSTPHTPRIPPICCIIVRKVKVQPDDGQHMGPKHVVVLSVVVYTLYYYKLNI